jgi:hypothetical protein
MSLVSRTAENNITGLLFRPQRIATCCIVNVTTLPTFEKATLAMLWTTR